MFQSFRGLHSCYASWLGRERPPGGTGLCIASPLDGFYAFQGRQRLCQVLDPSILYFACA